MAALAAWLFPAVFGLATGGRGLTAPASRLTVTPTMQMNSDSRPTAEYMDFLLGRNVKDPTVDQPAIIVGGGRIGQLLKELGERKGIADIVVRRGDPIPADFPGPIYVCTQNDDLAAVVAQTPEEKKPDLVCSSGVSQSTCLRRAHHCKPGGTHPAPSEPCVRPHAAQ